MDVHPIWCVCRRVRKNDPVSHWKYVRNRYVRLRIYTYDNIYERRFSERNDQQWEEDSNWRDWSNDYIYAIFSAAGMTFNKAKLSKR